VARGDGALGPSQQRHCDSGYRSRHKEGLGLSDGIDVWLL